MTARVCVGAIAGAYGVRGEVRLKSFCSELEAIADYAPLTTEDGARAFDLLLTGIVKNGLSARLSGITTKEEADALKGTCLYADRNRLPAPDEGEYYHADLIGLEVVDTGGASLGRVKAVLNHGAGDLLEIQPSQGQTILLPFTTEIVPTVDIALGRIVADPPEGLI